MLGESRETTMNSECGSQWFKLFDLKKGKLKILYEYDLWFGNNGREGHTCLRLAPAFDRSRHSARHVEKTVSGFVLLMGSQRQHSLFLGLQPFKFTVSNRFFPTKKKISRKKEKSYGRKSKSEHLPSNLNLGCIIIIWVLFIL